MRDTKGAIIAITSVENKRLKKERRFDVSDVMRLPEFQKELTAEIDKELIENLKKCKKNKKK